MRLLISFLVQQNKLESSKLEITSLHLRLGVACDRDLSWSVVCLELAGLVNLSDVALSTLLFVVVSRGIAELTLSVGTWN